MPDDFSQRPRRRNDRHPLRAFREAHPTLVWMLLVLAAVIALIVLTAHRFLH